MPEETETTTEEQPVEEQVEETEQVEDVDADVDDEDDAPENQDSAEYWRNKAKKNGNEAKNLRARLKSTSEELEPLKAAKLEADRKGMSDIDAANSRIQELEEKNRELTRSIWLKDVDARWDLPERAKEALTGTTAEEFMAAADSWAKDLRLERKDKTPRRTQTPPADLGGGRDSGKDKAPSIDAQIAEATKAGDWNKVARLNTQKLVSAGN